jgi:hypothetical protein
VILYSFASSLLFPEEAVYTMSKFTQKEMVSLYSVADVS